MPSEKWQNMKKTNWKLLWILILILLGFCLSVRVIEADPPPPTKLDHWLNQLKWKENCPEWGMVDSNGLKSYGVMCFQEATFKQYALKYNLLPHAEPNEIVNLIDNESLQKELAKRMIQDDPDNWRHWYNSVVGYKGRKGIGLPPK